ncbi:3-ketoacyl-CoA synthase 2-like [Rutidosis leptorrhynchoides]|uniref:3-ketoacyl-CoA synthase 2-like n=1 Tax=Rutidosis leptorrhynchoides TaxID=125765 RepID=UPI003A9A576D
MEMEILLLVLLICLFLICFVMIMTRKTSCNVYLIDFACYKPPSSQKCSKEHFVKLILNNGDYSEEMVDFLKKGIARSGLSNSTYLAEIFFEQIYKPVMKDSQKETEMSIFGSVDLLMAKTGVRCEDVGIVIVNCCIHNTVPCLSSLIVNKYKLREETVTYNLSGMGCSAGLLAIGLAKQLLQVHENSYALIVSTEIVTDNLYLGKDRSKHLTNFLFRQGAVAILLSNRPSDRKISKYQLLHAIHTNTSSSDRSYNSIFRDEDLAGINGVNINKDLVAAAIATVKPNVTALGYLILPIKEKFIYLIYHIVRSLLPKLKIHQYIPNYSTAVDHFLPHVGGKPVLEDLQRTLGFSNKMMEAARMTLYRFGNTSSSSIWYELAYVEAKGRVKKGNRVWQIGFGSGFKCSSIIWRAMKTVDRDDYNPWTDEIAGYPVTLEVLEPVPIFFESSKSKFY